MPPGRRWRGGRGAEGLTPRPIRGFVEPALLLLLHQGPSYGYELISGLARVGFSEYSVDPSTVYRCLDGLERSGMVLSTWDSVQSFGPPRRVYTITPAGEAQLGAWVAELRLTDRVLHQFLEQYDKAFPDAGDQS